MNRPVLAGAFVAAVLAGSTPAAFAHRAGAAAGRAVAVAVIETSTGPLTIHRRQTGRSVAARSGATVDYHDTLYVGRGVTAQLRVRVPRGHSANEELIYIKAGRGSTPRITLVREPSSVLVRISS